VNETQTAHDFWYTEDGEALCTDCARREGLSPDDPDSGLSELTPECAWETNRSVGSGFRTACSRCERVAPTKAPAFEWRLRCPGCGRQQLSAGRPVGKHPCPRCGAPRRAERNPHCRTTA